jgi:hypothetical protein
MPCIWRFSGSLQPGWFFDRPFDKLTILSNVKKLEVLSKVEGRRKRMELR